MPTTITISDALKADLERLRDDVLEADSFDAAIRTVLREPRDGERAIGDDDVLTRPVKVHESTRALLERIRDREDFADYDAVIRDRVGAELRDYGEQPVEVTPL